MQNIVVIPFLLKYRHIPVKQIKGRNHL